MSHRSFRYRQLAQRPVLKWHQALNYLKRLVFLWWQDLCFITKPRTRRARPQSRRSRGPHPSHILPFTGRELRRKAPPASPRVLDQKFRAIHVSAMIPLTIIPGEGLGPEIMNSCIEVLQRLDAPFEYEFCDVGPIALRKFQQSLPASTIQSVQKNKLVLMGPLSEETSRLFFRRWPSVNESPRVFAVSAEATVADLMCRASELLQHVGESQKCHRLRAALQSTLQKTHRDLGGKVYTLVFTQILRAELNA